MMFKASTTAPALLLLASQGLQGPWGGLPSALAQAISIDRKVDKTTEGQGVRIYQSLVAEERQRVFRLDVSPFAATGEVSLAGAVTLTRCNKNNINGKAGKDSPCYTVCGRDGDDYGELGACYPETEEKAAKYGTDFYDPRLHARIETESGDCACDWTDLLCEKEVHKCSLVLPECRCGLGPDGDKAYLVVTATTGNGVDPESNHVVELQGKEDKGFLVAYGRTLEEFEAAPRTSPTDPVDAQKDDSGDFEQWYRPVLELQIPAGAGASGGGGRLLVPRAEFDIELPNWDDDPSKTCNPLVASTVWFSEDPVPSGEYITASELEDDNLFINRAVRNCLWQQPYCDYDFADAAPWNDEYAGWWLTLVVSVDKSCVRDEPGQDQWSVTSAELSAKIVESAPAFGADTALCAGLMGRVADGERCEDSDAVCEARADLDGDSCDEWCMQEGLECVGAWNDGPGYCERGSQGEDPITCSSANKNRSICRCKVREPTRGPSLRPTPGPTPAPTKTPTPDPTPMPTPLPVHLPLCDPLLGLVADDDICDDSAEACEAEVDLDGASCDAWCDDRGYECVQAWDDGSGDCVRKNPIGCGKTGNNRSICRCGIATPGRPRLCERYLGEIWRHSVCSNTPDECEATADLRRNGRKESCDEWCQRHGLGCEKAWNDENFCVKKEEISCSKGGNSRSICLCKEDPLFI